LTGSLGDLRDVDLVLCASRLPSWRKELGTSEALRDAVKALDAACATRIAPSTTSGKVYWPSEEALSVAFSFARLSFDSITVTPVKILKSLIPSQDVRRFVLALCLSGLCAGRGQEVGKPFPWSPKAEMIILDHFYSLSQAELAVAHRGLAVLGQTPLKLQKKVEETYGFRMA